MKQKLGTLYEYLLPFKSKLLQALGLTILVTVLSLSPPLLTAILVDQVIVAGRWNLLIMVVLLIGLVPLCQHLVGFANNYLLSTTAQRLVFNVRTAMYRHIQKLPLRYFDKNSTGMVIERLMGDVATVQMMISQQTIQLLMDLVTAAFSITVMMVMNWRVAMIVLMLLPLYVLNYRFFVYRIRESKKRFRSKMDDLSGAIEERLQGTALVKSFGQERAETRKLVAENFQVMQHAADAAGWSVLFSGSANLLQWTGRIIVYFLGCYLVVLGLMSYGEVLAFTAYALWLLGPAVRISEFSNQIEQTMVSVDRIKEILEQPPEPEQPATPRIDQRACGHIRIENLWFAYHHDQWVLRDIDLDIPAGTTVALVGHTGCGKTTLTALLYRFYELAKGRILLDGRNIAEMRIDDLRRQMALVTQDVVVFDGTVADNIAYANRHADRHDIIQAAMLAEIHQVIQSLPDGYDTDIGQEGAKLSVGQRQRLVIARAILADPAILIMDEATSALDTESERLIQRALERVMANRTCFVVAHRLSTIVNADLIVVMDAGRIIEMGTHRELLQRPDGHYRMLYETQFAQVTPQDRVAVA